MKVGNKRAPLAERLTQSLKEGIDFAQGKKDLKATRIPAGRSYTGADVISIRERRRLSQSQFALLLAVSVKTLQSWEQGVRTPSKPTMRLLQLFDQPEAFREIVLGNQPSPKTGGAHRVAERRKPMGRKLKS